VPHPFNPQSLNRYGFSLSNPLKYTDPSGHCAGDPNDPENADYGCWLLIGEIENSFTNVKVDPNAWTARELEVLLSALLGLLELFGSDLDSFASAFGQFTIARGGTHWTGRDTAGITNFLRRRVTIFNSAYVAGDDVARYVIVHELGHVFDNPNGPWFVFKGLRSTALVGPVWPGNCLLVFSQCFAIGGASGTPVSDYARSNSKEDFAEAFAAYVFQQRDWPLPLPGYSLGDQVRRDIIAQLIALSVTSD
jgi:hypothetical protein